MTEFVVGGGWVDCSVVSVLTCPGLPTPPPYPRPSARRAEDPVQSGTKPCDVTPAHPSRV